MKLANKINLLYLIWMVALGSGGAIAAVPSITSRLGVGQYALEASPNTTLGALLEWRTDQRIGVETSKPIRELELSGVYEISPGGDWNVDADRFALRLPVLSQSHFWVGRTVPFIESTSEQATSVDTAVGSQWAQNRVFPLASRVSGWLGAGWAGSPLPWESIRFFASYSPVFVPTLTPRLELSPLQPAGGSRFTRLPPAYAEVSPGVWVPIRYQLTLGPLAEVIVRNQVSVGVGWEDRNFGIQALAWNAPDPDPTVDTSGILKSSASDLNALVQLRPSFLRDTWAGFRFWGKRLPLYPRLETVYRVGNRDWTFSAEVNPVLGILKMGYLNTWQGPRQSSLSVPEDGRRDDHLVWVEGRYEMQKWKLTPLVRIERNLGDGDGGWLLGRLSFEPAARWALWAEASFLTGGDRSWYGAWRSLDSVGVGTRWIW